MVNLRISQLDDTIYMEIHYNFNAEITICYFDSCRTSIGCSTMCKSIFAYFNFFPELFINPSYLSFSDFSLFSFQPLPIYIFLNLSPFPSLIDLFAEAFSLISRLLISLKCIKNNLKFIGVHAPIITSSTLYLLYPTLSCIFSFKRNWLIWDTYALIASTTRKSSLDSPEFEMHQVGITPLMNSSLLFALFFPFIGYYEIPILQIDSRGAPSYFRNSCCVHELLFYSLDPCTIRAKRYFAWACNSHPVYN